MQIDAMTLAKALAEAQKPLADQLVKIEQSMRALACTELARTIYDADELRTLRERMSGLVKADAASYDALREAHDALEGLSFHERVEKFGMADAEAARAPAEKARAARAATLEALNAFKAEHPLVYELVYHFAKPKA